METENKFDLVVSIDFGTTFTGYAYAYKGSKVISIQNWLDAYSAEVRLNSINHICNYNRFLKLFLYIMAINTLW